MKTKSHKVSITKLKNKIEDMAKEMAKIRDNYTCQHCGKQVEGSNCHGSHVIPKSHGNALRFDLMNIKTLCYHCHLNWWHKHPTESGEWFKQKFPDRYKYLEKHKQDEVHWKEADFLALADLYKKKLAEL